MAKPFRSSRNWLETAIRRSSPIAPPSEPPRGSLAELIAQAIRWGDSRSLAGQLLATDPLYRRVRPEQRRAAIDFGLAAGQSAARKLATERGISEPFAMAEALGVAISFTGRQACVGSQVHYSEYSCRKTSITIYRQAMDEVNTAIGEHGLEAELGVGDITPIHVAHELYHHIEFHSKPAPTAGFRVTTFAAGPISLNSGLMSLSEVAANAFAQELLGLRLFPAVLEFITVYQHNAPLAWAMLDRLNERRE